MKKLLILATVFAAVLMPTSCQKIGPVIGDGKANVNFTLQTPVDAVTKAIGDGENVDIVYYEIYLKQDNHVNSINGGSPLVDRTVAISGGETSLKLNLLEDQDYVALFWAEVIPAEGTKFYNTGDLRKVEALYEGVDSNDESRAAFCQRLEFNTSNKVNKTVTLVRPFAQLNIGTTLESLNIDYRIDVTASKVTVTTPARFYNVNTGVAHTPTAQPVEFAMATNPQQYLNVNNTDYEYVAMNYFFVSGNTSSVDVVFDIVTDKGTVTDKEVAQVPVQQNYRTNIIGNLLTKETKIEIVVDNRFIADLNSNEDGGYTEVPNPDYN